MNIKLLIAYHKKSKLYHDDILTPIHLGRKIANKEGKDYNYEEFGDMVFELGDEGWIFLDEYEIYKTY